MWISVATRWCVQWVCSDGDVQGAASAAAVHMVQAGTHELQCCSIEAQQVLSGWRHQPVAGRAAAVCTLHVHTRIDPAPHTLHTCRPVAYVHVVSAWGEWACVRDWSTRAGGGGWNRAGAGKALEILALN